MKRFANVILLGLLLTAIEYVILFICLYTEEIIKHTVSGWDSAFRGANEIIAIRFIFYFVFWIGAMYILFDKVRYPVWRLAIANCLLYVVTSVVVSGFLPGAAEFFTYSFFFYLVAATFVSPFVLRLMPYLKKVAFYAGFLLSIGYFSCSSPDTKSPSNVTDRADSSRQPHPDPP